MPRISHCLTLAAGNVVLLAILLARPAWAEPPSPSSHPALWYHPAYAPDVYRYGHRRVAAILQEIEASPYYRQFGGDEDTHSAWAFPLVRNQRHYFGGRGWRPEWVVSPR
jgi:hypothetical protein